MSATQRPSLSRQYAVHQLDPNPEKVNGCRSCQGTRCPSGRVRGVLARVGAAGLTEGGTEVLQGMSADALLGYATDDWGEFKDRFTRSDVSLQEFMVGGLMGGGVRGAFEVVDPSNYRTFEAWKADQQAEIDKAGAQGEGGVVNEAVAEGQEAPSEPGTAPVAGIADLGQAINPQGSQGVTLESEPKSTDSVKPVRDGVQTLLDANKVEGREVDPPSERHTQLRDRFKELGINLRFVDGGQRLNKPAASVSAGEIVVDVNATEDQQLEGLAWHEAVHDVERRDAGAWGKLRDDLKAVVPEMFARAEAKYAREWNLIHNEDASADRITHEGPSVLAEEVIDTILEISENPEVFGELMRKNPSLADRIIGTIQALARRIRAYSGLTRLEQAREEIQTNQDHAKAAALIRDAVEGLRYAPVPQHTQTQQTAPIPPSAPVEQTRSVSPSDTQAAPVDAQPVAGVEDTQTVSEQEPPKRAVFPRNKSKGEFSNRDIRKRLEGYAVDAGFDHIVGAESLELGHFDANEVGIDRLELSFSGPLPAEIKEALEGAKPGVRQLFGANVRGAGGADTMAAIGADEMVRRAELFAERGEKGMSDFIDRTLSNEQGDVGMLRVVASLRDGKYVKDFAPIEVVDEPADLPDGATFEIEGSEFVVYTAENSAKRASDGQRDFNLGIEAMPITKGSLRKDAGAEVAEAALDIPFAVNPKDDDAGVFGQRMFRSNTGSQNPLFGSQEQSETQLDKEEQARHDEAEKRIGNEPEQGVLFAVENREQKIRAGEPLTEHDTPGIIEARQKSIDIPQTHLDNSKKRIRKRKRIARALYGNGAKNKGHRAVLVLGPPGAGKSGVAAEPLAESLGALIVDSDLAKEHIPEFDGGIGAMAVHRESNNIAMMVYEKAADAGDNMVIPRVGGDEATIREVLETLNDDGYSVDIVYVGVPTDDAVRRVITRFESENRFVDPEYVISVDQKPHSLYNTLKKEGDHASYSEYSNEVQQGQLPILINSTEGAIPIPHQRAPQRGGLGGDHGEDGGGRTEIPPGETRAEEGREGPNFAVAPQGEPQENLPGVSPINESFITQGRPDLANPGRSDEARNLVDQFDELRNQRGEPQRVADNVAQERAERIIANDAEGAERDIHEKIGRNEALNDVETAVAFKLVNKRAMDALRDGSKANYRKSLEIHESYRRSGTLWARAGRQRRDTELGPRERYQAAITNALLFPDANFKRKLEELHRIIDDPKSSKRKVQRARETQANLFDRESKKMRRIKKDLAKKGIDPRILNHETMADPVFASIVVDTARRARTNLPDALYWVWMNSILSGPLTHAANMIGNTANFAYRFGVIKGLEAGAGSLHKVAGGDPDFTMGDYAHMWGTLGKSLALGWQNAARAYATNRQVFDEQITGKFLPTNTFKGEDFFIPDAGPRSKALRVAGLGGIPLKLLMAEDQFFKTVAGVMHAHSLAHRQAVREGLEGEARDARITELLEPREGLFGQQQYDSDIWNQSLEEARVVTFQDDPSVIGRTALKFRSGELGKVARWIIPFIRTPDRLFVRGLESSILGGLNAALQAGGKVVEDTTGKNLVPDIIQSDSSIQYDAALAVAVLGMLAAIAGYRDDDEGFPRITGSRTPDWRDGPEQYRTAPPMSIRIGEKWYSYSRIEPLSTSLALTIDLLDRMEQGEGLEEQLPGSLETLIALTKDKTFVRGIGEIFELFEDPERAGENAANLTRRTLVTAWVPNLFKQTARAFNPEISDNRAPKDAGFWEKQAARIPYEALPVSKLAPTPRYDIWGRPIERSGPADGVIGTLWRLGVPINVSDHNLHPMDLLIYNYNQKVASGEIDRALDVDGADSAGEIHARPPSRYFTRGGERIDLSAEEYQALIRNAGERASERLLAMNLNVENPSPRDVERIKSVLSREYSRERTRIYKDRRAGDS